jgi:DNA-directed RNA polymerase specialized sigma24 family protein
VELRYFAGLSREEIAELLGCGVRTVARDWVRARAFLYARLEAATPPPPEPTS